MRGQKTDWLGLESRLRSILREAFAEAESDPRAATLALHRVDAALAARTGRGETYEGDLEALDVPTREARLEEWEAQEGGTATPAHCGFQAFERDGLWDVWQVSRWTGEWKERVAEGLPEETARAMAAGLDAAAKAARTVTP